MADLLSLIREYNINKRDITERENEVIFGDFAWPKQSKTNYIIWGTNRSDSAKDYYTLECILYLLKNIHLNHAQYVRQAAASGVPVVRLPDRKDLLAYLNGELLASENIDKSAPLDINVQRPVAVSKRVTTDLDADGADVSASKRVCMDESIDMELVQREKEKQKERLQAKLEDSTAKQTLDLTDQNKDYSLKEAMSLEKIKAIRMKRLVKMRGSIKQDEAGLEPDAGSRLRMSYLTGDSDIVREILSKERYYKSRNSCLQATVKNFAESVLNGTLKAIKNREEGANTLTARNSAVANPANRVHHIQYSRYDQEKFTSGDATAALFKIDTSGWGGMGMLRNSSAVNDPRPTDPRRMGQQNPFGSTPVNKSPLASPGPQKRTSKTPVIIIPATASLIGMLNVKDILLDKRFVSVDDKKRQGMRRENEVLIHRMKPDGTTVPFRVIDQPFKLTPDEWERVCAVFVQGPAWQFKNWPIGKGNPVDIFVKLKAFHLKFADLPTEPNVMKWNVTVLELDRHKRHLDRAVLQTFWDELDKYMVKHKSHLRF